MEAKILQFCRLLRRGGINISFTQIADALQAVSEVGFGWDDFYIAMRSIMIADHADQSLFDRLFRLFFLSLPVAEASAGNAEIISEDVAEPTGLIAEITQSADGTGISGSRSIPDPVTDQGS